MLTKKVKNRIMFVILFLFISVLIIFFTFKTLKNNLLYFQTPTEVLLNENLELNKLMRLGGMVKENSLISSKKEIKFIITDFKNEIRVSYNGAVPNLFLEGKGVIAEGKLRDKKYFIANKILAKHDENYMPPELKGLLEKNVK